MSFIKYEWKGQTSSCVLLPQPRQLIFSLLCHIIMLIVLIGKLKSKDICYKILMLRSSEQLRQAATTSTNFVFMSYTIMLCVLIGKLKNKYIYDFYKIVMLRSSEQLHQAATTSTNSVFMSYTNADCVIIRKLKNKDIIYNSYKMYYKWYDQMSSCIFPQPRCFLPWQT